MKKLLLILISTFVFFGCASTDAESSSEMNEILPVESEVLPEDLTDYIEENDVDNLETTENQLDISNTSDENLILDENQSIIIENPQEKIDESSSESLESPEVIENQDSEEHLSLMINPENYESPDYVEFLPLIKENEIDLDFLEEEQNEDTIEELYEESNEIIIEESSEENIKPEHSSF